MEKIPKEHYFKGYDTKERWISYWHQISEVLETGKKNVLEVGKGNGAISDYLKKRGINITTVDIDPNLNPDYTCSVTELTKNFPPNSFDVILCAEVLEHLPFQFFEKAVDELYSITKDYVIISLPYCGHNIRFLFEVSVIGGKSFKLKIPQSYKHNNPEHYWEIGTEQTIKEVLTIMEKRFKITKNYLPMENMYHNFFVLRK
jgi:predicted SAM-dependent methyltransferase